MIRQAAFVLCSVIAVAQVTQEDPFDIANREYFQARQTGRYDVAATQRDRMNHLLRSEALDDPQFANRAQSLAQVYDSDGMMAAGREVLEGALARVGANEKSLTRASLLLALASTWERDRNLLKSLAFMESAAVILEQTPAVDESTPTRWYSATRQAMAARPNGVSSARSSLAFYGSISGSPHTASLVSVYMQLAELYQRLGRRDQAAAMLVKIKALPGQESRLNLAQYYERDGDLEQAADFYRMLIDANPAQMTFAAQRLSSIYQQMKRPDDAAAVLRQAITAIDASGNRELSAHSGLPEQLAMLLYGSGHAEAADQAYPPPPDNGPADAGSTVNYANYLATTQRAAQAETFLSGFLTGHASLNAGEQGLIFMSLANLARGAGDSKRAEEYQLASEQKRQREGLPGAVNVIGPVLQKAQSEASMGNTAEAIGLVQQAIAQSKNAQDREMLVRIGPSVANTIGNKAAHQADELYRNVIEATQGWSAETMGPSLAALEGYPRFLMSLQRSGEALPAIERYRSALKTAHGADTGWLEEPHRQTIDVERARNSLQAAILAAQNLMSLEETLDGPVSEPLYRAAETLAELYRATGDASRALHSYQQAIAIADALFGADDRRRSQPRTNAATMLIADRRLEEAEMLVTEAIQLRKVRNAGARDGLMQMLEQIKAMKKAP